MAVLRNIIAWTALLPCVGLAGASPVHLSREVEQTDPISGLHWQRVLDPTHPAAPPRWMLIRGSGSEVNTHGELRRPTMCVRSGDHVLLRSSNAGLSALSIEARVLENGACGSRVRARVTVTGAVVEVTVLDSGAGVLGGAAATWR
jgi:Chaperone for flagella basal body P-ring formation